jgi:hypothetical protein
MIIGRVDFGFLGYDTLVWPVVNNTLQECADLCCGECIGVTSAMKMEAAGSSKMLKPFGKHVTGMK